MENNKKLFLLDAFALIYRAYYAFIRNPRVNSKGMNTSAAFGFTNTLLDVIQKEQPSHIAVVFDSPEITNRAEEYAAYKANREEMPEDIRQAIPYIKEIIQGFNIPILLKAGFEADDIIGTLAKRAEEKGYITYMMTPDKDFGQLVSDNIFMYKPAISGKPAEKLGVKEICEKFEVSNPLQVIDILGLWGDAVDNIPGIPGIGEKTAKKLIGIYGSVEKLIENAEDLKGKQKENVIEFAEQGLLSKKLATIITDVPVEFDETSLIIEPLDKAALEKVFQELEFRNLIKRISGDNAVSGIPSPTSGQLDLFGSIGGSDHNGTSDQNDFQSLSDQKVNYSLLELKSEIEEFVNLIKGCKEIAFDTETTSVSAMDAELVGVSLSHKSGNAVYIPVSENINEAKKLIEPLKQILEDEGILKIGQNVKYDIAVLSKYEIEAVGPFFDTMIAHYLLHPDMRHNMDLIAGTYLDYAPISIESLIGKKGKSQKTMRQIPPEDVRDYACEDADVTFRLKEKLLPDLLKNNLNKLFSEIEIPLMEVLSEMERNGVNLDVDALNKFSKELFEDIGKLQNQIINLCGEEFNLDSPKQLGEVLFEKMQIAEKPKKTKTGQYSTGEDVLSKMAMVHPVIPLILDYRSLKKLKSTYVDTLPEMVNSKTGKLHTSYIQTIAATGRLSSNNPNLQNIPIRTEKGREIRKAFIPSDDNHLLLSADYSQVELRIMAHLSQDKNMIDAFNQDLDIHTATASRIFNVPIDEVSSEMRYKAKSANFGIIYGISAFGLSQNLNISRNEAKELIDNYFAQYPGVKSYMDDSIENARQKGYVETIMGRKRYLHDISSANANVRGHAERNAINAPIQGSAADVIKIAMIRIHEEMKELNLKSKMILQVHDELVFDVIKNEIPEVENLVKKQMESAVKLRVLLKVEMDTGTNWLNAH